MMLRTTRSDVRRPDSAARCLRHPRSLFWDRRGANLTEYIILIAAVALVAVAGYRVFGRELDAKIRCDAASITGAAERCSLAGGEPTMAPVGNVPESPARPSDGGGDPKKGNPVLGFFKSVGNALAHTAAAGIVFGIRDDAVGLWHLITNPWGTIKDAGTGIYHQIRDRAESDAVTAVDQWRHGNKWGAAWTVAKGAWSSSEGLLLNTFVIDSGVKNDWKNGNYPSAIGRVVWNVGSWFIPGVDVAEWASKASKIGKAADAAEEAAKAAKGADDAAKGADDAAKADKAGKTGKALHIDPVTARTLEKYGLTPDSELYRVVNPKYLNTKEGTIAGNPNSVALIRDPYHLVENPVAKAFEDAGIKLPPDFPRTIPATTSADKVGPGLNVAVKDPALYGDAGKVTIAIKVKDILDAGGKFYPDSGAIGQTLDPLYVTFDGSIPYRKVPP
jgi:hypothetical protein